MKMIYGEPMPLVRTTDVKPQQKTTTSRTKAEINSKLDSLIAKLEALTTAVQRSRTVAPEPFHFASKVVQAADSYCLYEKRCAASQAAYDARNPHKQ